MSEVALFMGIIGLTIFAGYLASIFFDRTKIPDVLILIFLGMIIGPIAHIIDPSQLANLAPFIGTIALVIIVFDGSTKLNLNEVLDELPESIWFTLLMSGLTVILVTIIFLISVTDVTWVHGLLAGMIVAGTSYEIIVPLVAKLDVKEKVKTLLNLESAFNDVFTIVGVVMIIGYMSPKIGKIGDPLQIIVSTLSIAIFLGIIGGVFWVKVLQQYKGKQFEYLLTIAFVFFLYSISEIYQGNGITSVLIFGLLLGNSDALARMFKMKEDLSLDPAITNFNNEISFFVRTMFFVYMGIILNLQKIDLNLTIIALLMFIAALVARYLAVKVLAWRNPQMADSELIISALMPRGLATAVLAALVADLAIDGINFPNISEIVVLFILFTNIFATVAVFYYETQMVPFNKKATAQSPTKGK